MTTMIERPETVALDQRLETLDRRNRNLGVTVVILGILVLALGAWIAYDYSQESVVAASSEMTQLLDDYTAAWNDYDGAAFLALTTEGYRFTSAGGMEFFRADQATEIESTLPSFAWQVEKLGDPVVTGDGPWYVAVPNETTTNIRDAQGVSIITVVDIDGTLKVASHRVIGDF